MILYYKDEMYKKIHISESKLGLLDEDVYVGSIKGKKANLNYKKRSQGDSGYNKGNMKATDVLKTDKMDMDNEDTYIVPLKGGINSYNITSIRGTEVMHYFKNKFEGKKTNIEIDVNGKKGEYELMMQDSEFQAFKKTFIKKVSNVVSYAINEFRKQSNDTKFNGITIFPVKSSSNFNTTMVDSILCDNNTISNLHVTKIDERLFEKNLNNLQKDDDFINKNNKYYNSRMFKFGDNNITHLQYIDNEIDKLSRFNNAQNDNLINEYNKWIKRTIQSLYTNSSPKTIARNYNKIVNIKKQIREMMGKLDWNKVFTPIKYAKGPSVESRTTAIQQIVASVYGKTYISKNNIDIVEIKKNNFQIKNISNDTRMGLMNYFQLGKNMESEIDKIKGTIFVIFDDNISGGATLSDICYQAKKIGIEYVVPITFGQMNTKYTQGMMVINSPENGFMY